MKLDKSGIRRAVLTELAAAGQGRYIPVGISARHVHLSEADIAKLFGQGYHLHPIKALSQPGQFAAREQVTVIGPRGSLEHVRVLGPARKQSQVEISISDSFVLGAKKCPVRLSGELDGSMGVRLAGPNGEVELKEGMIVAARHLHMSNEEAQAFGVHDRQIVSVRISGDRPCIMENVVCRTGDGHALELHVDTDEANACALGNDDLVELISMAECERTSADSERSQSMNCSNTYGGERKFSMSAVEPEGTVGSRNADAAGLPNYTENGKASLPCAWRQPTPAQKHAFNTVANAKQDIDVPEEMILELVTERDIRDAFRDNRRQVYCDKKALITPAARESAESAGIQIVRIKGGN